MFLSLVSTFPKPSTRISYWYGRDYSWSHVLMQRLGAHCTYRPHLRMRPCILDRHPNLKINHVLRMVPYVYSQKGKMLDLIVMRCIEIAFRIVRHFC